MNQFGEAWSDFEKHPERSQEDIIRDKAREMFERMSDDIPKISLWIEMLDNVDSQPTRHHRRMDIFVDELRKLLKDSQPN